MGFAVDARWILGSVHLLTLGWLSGTLLGAMSQMVPAHSGARLRCPWGVSAGFWLLAVGLSVFVAQLWSGQERYWQGAALAGAAMLFYLASYAPTLAAAKQLPFTERHFVAALGFLAAVGSLGVLLALDRQRGWLLRSPDRTLVAHIHLAVVGWIGLSIIGASYRLFFPVSLARGEDARLSRAASVLIGLGALGLAGDALWLGLRAPQAWAVMMALGYAAYLAQLRFLSRPGWEFDPPMAFTFLALAGGVAWAVLGLALAFGALADDWEARAAYGVCALLGWATPWVMGQTHKIFPFLVWRAAYGEHPDPPRVSDMGRVELAWIAAACLALGWPLAAVGLLAGNQALVTSGLALVLACATAHAAQSALWLSHLFGDLR